MKSIQIGNTVTTRDGQKFEVYDIVDGIVYAYSLKYREDCTVHFSNIIKVQD